MFTSSLSLLAMPASLSLSAETEPWLGRARALKNRIRDRFGVAVDRRRHRLRESHYALALRRCSQRIRAQTGSSSPASLRVYPHAAVVDSLDDSLLVRLLRSLAVPLIGCASHAFMHGLNHVQVYGVHKLHKALLERPQGTPLITISNHVAAIDDPFVIASLLPPSVMLNANNLRWTLCASDRCFKNRAMSAFFRSVKVMPVSRGDGIYQKGMDMALSKLNKGCWVHIFPEGSRSRNDGRTVGPTKRGVGRLVIDADTMPIVLPFVHSGMQDIMPVGTKFPNIGKRVIVVVGDPISFDDLLPDRSEANDPVSREMVYDLVSSRIGMKLQELKTQADKLALERSQQIYVQNGNAHSVWQHVDWEMFGMSSMLKSSDEASQIGNKTQDIKQIKQLQVPVEESSIYFSSNNQLCYGGGILSPVRGYMNPCELMGFAARGLFANGVLLESRGENMDLLLA